MLIILITVLTTSAARTTHSYDNIESDSKHLSFLPVLDVSSTFRYGNGNQLVPAYSYPQNHDLKSSDVVFPGSNIHRRVRSEYAYTYPYENSNRQWNRPTVTKAAQLSDRFEDNVKEENVFNYLNGKKTQKPGAVANVENGQFDKPQNNSKNNRAQLEKLNIKLQINVSNYTKSAKTIMKPNSTNLNTPRNLNMYPTIVNQNNSSLNQSSINSNQNSVKNMKNNNFNNSTNTNIFTTESYNRTMGPNINLDVGGTYGTKTPRDNEVKEESNGDRWIWSNSETTTLVPLNDRAAFAGNNCPAGTVRIRDTCVAVD